MVNQLDTNDPKEAAIEQIGRDVQSRLKQYFEQWEGGLSFRAILSNYSVKASKLGFTTTEFANELMDRGFIKIFLTPSGSRFVFPGDCPLSLQEIQEWLHTQEVKKETDKEAKRAVKAAE